MTREEAIEVYNGLLNQKIKEAFEFFAPELAESEDERITRAINNMLPFIPEEAYANNGVTKEDVLNWLKKQKELPFVKDVVLGYPGVYFYDGERMHFRGSPAMEEKQKEPHYTKRNELFDKCVENCDPKTVEEVNKRVDDIMIMSEFSAFEQALTNFIGDWENDEEHWPSQFVKKHGKHVLDMAREELQKEQKHVQTADEKEYIRIIKSLIADFIRDKKPEDVAYYQKIYDWLDGRHIEQKPVPISCSHENGSPAEVCYGPKGDPDPADTPEYEYIRKDAILERIKERLKLYDPDNPEEETTCYELQSIISWLDGKEETK